MGFLFNEFLYRPLFNALVFLYNTIPGPDFGLAIIALTIVIRLVLYPLNQKALKSQKEMTELQPKIKEVQQKFKNSREKQAQALMELYKTHKINPFSGFFALFIQFPILIALFKVFRDGFEPEKLNMLYSFIENPGQLNPMFLGLLDLSKSGSLPLAILAGSFQFIQSMMIKPKKDLIKTESKELSFTKMMGKQMTYFFPILTFFFAWSFPAGLALYWTATTIFGIGQYWLIKKKNAQQEHNQKNN